MTEQFPTQTRKARFSATLAPQVVPLVIADAGGQTAWRYVKCFTVNIRNAKKRRAHARACRPFLAWCEVRGLTLAQTQPHDVGAYIETLQASASAPIPCRRHNGDIGSAVTQPLKSPDTVLIPKGVGV